MKQKHKINQHKAADLLVNKPAFPPQPPPPTGSEKAGGTGPTNGGGMGGSSAGPTQALRKEGPSRLCGPSGERASMLGALHF